MVRINKPKSETPEILKSKGAAEIKLLKAMTVKKLIAYKYKSSLYGGKEVKTKLKELQFGKCCFCEAKVFHISHGDVEHFRPKAGWVQKEKEKITKPGYYWLAYDFSNLFVSCQICNQTYKKNYFPLSNPAKRAKKHSSSISAERPLIIDPSKEDPKKHLAFNKEIIVARDNSKKGIETIKRTGLDRADLNSSRMEYLQALEVLAIIARKSATGSAQAKKHFKECGKPSAIYSLMVRENFPDLV